MTTPIPASAQRIQSVDILRGIVMIIMALDHTRDFFSDFMHDPTDLHFATNAMFLTRWVTHFCAPVFIFLTGASAFLYSRRQPRRATAFWLLSRGLWLIVLQFTVIRFGWTFDLEYRAVTLQVMWALACCMVSLSALVFLPWQVILGIGLFMIFGHDIFDGFQPSAEGAVGISWHLLHIKGLIAVDKTHTLMVNYPLVPWIGVMAVGYTFGMLFSLPAHHRDKYHHMIGWSAIALFIVLRLANVYGDPARWISQSNPVRTILSFVNCSKYPPSLLYLLMTLGPAIAALPLLEKSGKWMARICTVYGRVPLFYYIVHIYIIQLTALLLSYLLQHNAPVSLLAHPGYPLYVVYIIWLFVVGVLFIPCQWFMRVKMKYKWWWLSYL